MEEFSFEHGEARLGRTADNDVVIRDPSSSRSHARVYEEEGHFFVEDLKSANGTRLNSKVLKVPAELQPGDLISIGEVVLEFSASVRDDGPAQSSSTLAEGEEGGADDPEEDVDATKLRPLRKSQASAIGRAPRAGKPPAPRPKDGSPNGGRPTVSALSARTSGAKEGAGSGALSAADRARQRRELQKSSFGRAVLLWGSLSKPARVVLSVLGGLVALGLLALLVKAMLPKQIQRKSEQTTLVPNGESISESFGLGEGVTFLRPDMKAFSFSYASPAAIVGVLHYQSSDCDKDEVSIELNGTQIGMVPPDTVDTSIRELEVVLPSTLLRNNDVNQVVFDNVVNPPGSETWRVWNIWVEVIPIPKLNADEAAQRAKQDIDRAAKMYELRDVGAPNLFRAWKQYREAWLMLEATPEHRPELLETARSRMREIRPELDRKCSTMLVEYQKEMNRKRPNINIARQVLQNIPAYFEKEHPCFGISRALLRSLSEDADTESP